jgi:hypothetical protein
MDGALIDQALGFAEDRFDERVAALIKAADGDGSRLALAAATVSTSGPTAGDSKEQIAFALLLEAAHRAGSDERHVRVVDASTGSSAQTRSG